MPSRFVRRVRTAVVVVTSAVLALSACSPAGTETRRTTSASEVAAGQTVAPAPSATPTPSPSPTRHWSEPPPEPELDGIDDEQAAALVGKRFLELYSYVYNTGDTKVWRALSHPDCIFCSSVLDNVRDEPDGLEGAVAPVEVEVTRTVGFGDAFSVDSLLYEPSDPEDDDPVGRVHAIAMNLRLDDGEWRVRAVEVMPVQVLRGEARQAVVGDVPRSPVDRTSKDASDGVGVAAHYASLLLHGLATERLDRPRKLEHASCETWPELAEALREDLGEAPLDRRATLEVVNVRIGSFTTDFRNVYVWLCERPPAGADGAPGVVRMWTLNVTAERLGGKWQVTFASGSVGPDSSVAQP